MPAYAPPSSHRCLSDIADGLHGIVRAVDAGVRRRLFTALSVLSLWSLLTFEMAERIPCRLRV